MEHSTVCIFKFALNEDEANELLDVLRQPNARRPELYDLLYALEKFCDQHRDY